MKNGRLDGKVAIVTGSTSGIGEATAILFAKEGAKVIIVGRRAERGQQVARKIQDDGGEAVYIQTDLTDDDQIKSLAASTIKKYGRIDVLVNIAGTIIEKPFLELTLDDFEYLAAIDAKSYLRSMQYVLPQMERQGKGSIVNVTSLLALKPIPTQGLYSFMKAGVTQMTRVAAQEFVRKNIRINAVLPGATWTDMVKNNPNISEVEGILPIGRLAKPEEVAYPILFLASDEASYITGELLIVDGGANN